MNYDGERVSGLPVKNGDRNLIVDEETETSSMLALEAK